MESHLKRHTVWPGESKIRQTPQGETLTLPKSIPEKLLGRELPERVPVRSLPRIPVVSAAPQNHTLPSRIPVAGKPWNFYKGFLSIELGGRATLASRKTDHQVFAIKKLEGTVEEIRQLVENSHKNIVQCHEVYFMPNSIFLVEECMDVSLAQVIACPEDLSEQHIATICSEVLGGMTFLESLGLTHESIKPQNVLLSLKGEVKISNFSHCKRVQSAAGSLGKDYARSLGLLAMEMMDRNVFVTALLTKGVPVLQHPDHWSGPAKNFLQAASWAPLDDMVGHNFLKNATGCSSLIPHIRLAMATVRREWSCVDLEEI